MAYKKPKLDLLDFNIWFTAVFTLCKSRVCSDEKETLRGIKSMSVMIEDIRYEAKEAGINKENFSNASN